MPSNIKTKPQTKGTKSLNQSKSVLNVNVYMLMLLALIIVPGFIFVKSLNQKQEYNNEVLAAETSTFYPSEDAHVKSANGGSNYANVDTLITSSYSSTNIQLAYMKFDLSSLSDKTITSATLTLTPNLDRKVEKTVKLVTDTGWQEGSLTWNNKPGMSTTIGSLSSQEAKVGTPITITLDATSLQAYAGKTLSIGLDNNSSANTFSVYSSEAPSSKPLLTITTEGSSQTPTPTDPVDPTPTDPVVVTPPPVTTDPTALLPAVTETDSRITCSKYPEKRVFLETQAWWMDTDSVQTSSQIPLDGIGGHTHTATCFPQDQLIAGGKLQFDVRLMLHKGNVGEVTWLEVKDGNSTTLAKVAFATPLTCPGATDPKKMCEAWVPIEMDTAKMRDGYQELRFRFNVVQPNGERQFASTGWEAYYRTKVGSDRKYPWLEARGWYTGANYANARLLSPVPYQPVSGQWTIKVGMVPGADGVSVTSHSVHVDAKFNLDKFGWTVMEGANSYTGNVTIDTTKLSNGLHYVAIKSDQDMANGGTNTGILQFPIIVKN